MTRNRVVGGSYWEQGGIATWPCGTLSSCDQGTTSNPGPLRLLLHFLLCFLHLFMSPDQGFCGMSLVLPGVFFSWDHILGREDCTGKVCVL